MIFRLPTTALYSLPVGLRLYMAKWTLWRLRHRAKAQSYTLMISIVVLSGCVGYLAGVQKHPGYSVVPMRFDDSFVHENIASLNSENRGIIDRSNFPGAAEWGALRARMVKLSVLFRRLAAHAELHDPEFHMDLALGPDAVTQDFRPYSTTQSGGVQRYELANRAVTHISNRSVALLSIYQRRIQSDSLALSGVPVEQGSISSGYGYRNDPYSGLRQFHHGVDFSGKKGSKVLALADGVVTYSGRNGGYGNLVELEHANGYRSRYAHNETNLVEVGRYVSKGQEIATMGSTGRSTGTHVHVEVRHHAKAIDPMQFIQ